MSLKSDYKIFPGGDAQLYHVQVEAARCFRRVFDDLVGGAIGASIAALTKSVADVTAMVNLIAFWVAHVGDPAITALQPVSKGKILTHYVGETETTIAHGLDHVPLAWFPGSFQADGSHNVWQTSLPDATNLYLAAYPACDMKILVV